MVLVLFISSCQKEAHTFVIGETFGGGIIFYIDSIGQHGLIAAPHDMDGEGSCNQTGCYYWWGCEGTTITVLYDSMVGAGLQNTADILKGCSATETAAEECEKFQLGIYKDWFLPSQLELNLMYKNLFLKNIGNFTEAYYWSSTERGPYFAYGFCFCTKPGGGGLNKNTKYKVRAIRAF